MPSEIEINNAIKKCKWLSDNKDGNLLSDICTGMCLPCERVIDRGQCDTLIKLFRKEKKNVTKDN